MFVIFRTDVIVEALITVKPSRYKKKKTRKKHLELGSNLTRDSNLTRAANKLS